MVDESKRLKVSFSIDVRCNDRRRSAANIELFVCLHACEEEYGAAVIYVLNIGDGIFFPGMKPAVSPVEVRKNKIDRNVLFVDALLSYFH